MTADTLIIDCRCCIMRATSTCRDCVVTFLCDRDPAEAVVFDVVQERAVRLLSEAGLVPRLRHRQVV